MLTGLTRMTWSIGIVGALLALGQVLTVLLDIHGTTPDDSLVYFNHALLGVFVLLVGGKAASVDKSNGAPKA